MVIENREMKQPNYKLGNRTLIGSAILVLIIFLLCSCGARKVDKSHIEIHDTETTEATFKDSSKTVTKLESNTKIVDVSQSDELVITPIDSSKEFSVNGVKYKGVVLKAKKVRNNITTDKSINVAKTSQNDVKKALKNETAKEAIIDTKESDRGFNYLSLLWLLIIPVIYFGYRKFKGLPLV